MSKILLGVVLGIALATVAFVVLGPSLRSGGGSPVGESPAGGTRDASSEQAASLSAVDASVAEPVAVESGVPASADLDERSSEADRAGNTDALTDALAELAALPPPTLPIVLPREFSYLTEIPNFYHERLQREMPDPNWFAQTEADLRTYFAAHPEITNKYGFPTISCRTSGCAVAFVAYGLEYPAVTGAGTDGPSFAAVMAFRRDNQAFFDGPLGPRFNGELGVVSDSRVEGDVTTIYWILPRGDRQTNATGSGSAPI